MTEKHLWWNCAGSWHIKDALLRPDWLQFELSGAAIIPLSTCCIMLYHFFSITAGWPQHQYHAVPMRNLHQFAKPFQAEPLLDQGQFGSSKATDADAAETPALKVVAWVSANSLLESQGEKGGGLWLKGNAISIPMCHGSFFWFGTGVMMPLVLYKVLLVWRCGFRRYQSWFRSRNFWGRLFGPVDGCTMVDQFCSHLTQQQFSGAGGFKSTARAAWMRPLQTSAWLRMASHGFAVMWIDARRRWNHKGIPLALARVALLTLVLQV